MAKRDMPARKEVSNTKQTQVIQVETNKKDPELIELMVNNCNDLNVRSGPTRKAAVITTIPKGTVIHVKNMVDDWFEIEVSNSKISGFVLSQYTSEVE